MTVSIKDRVKQTSSTTGTGTLTLSGTPSGYQSFASAFSNGDTVYYVIENAANYEIGIGTYNVGTLSRDTVLKSSNSNSHVSLSGRSTVFCSVPAQKTVYLDNSGESNLNIGSLTDVTLGSPTSGETLIYNGSNWANGFIPTYTDEQAQDAVGNILVSSTGINVIYNDGAPSITISSTGLLQSSLNLSDLTSVSTARTNLGLGTAALSNSGDFYLSTNPSGYISSAAVAAGYQPLDGDLTALAAVTGTNNIYYRSAANTWSSVSVNSPLTFAGGVLSATGLATSGDLSSYVPLTRTLTINGTSQDLSSNRSWTVGDVFASGSYSNPSWITSLAWSKISGTPTTLSGYGITDAQPLDGDLTAIAALTGTNNIYYRSAVNTWSSVVIGSGLTFSGGTLSASGSVGGISSLNTLTDSSQTFATGTTGTDFGIVSASGIHTFNLPDASATARGLVTTGSQTFAGQKTFAQGTLTASAPLTLTQTWNNAGVTFTGMLVDVTNTASNSASILSDYRVGGASVFQVLRDGSFRFGTSTNGFTLNGATNAFYYHAGAIGTSGRSFWATVQKLQMCSDGVFSWSSTLDSANTSDLLLYRDAAGTLSQRNGTNAQAFRIENTFTSTTNREYFQQSWVSNELRMGTAVGSAGGTQRNTVIGTWNAAGTWSPTFTLTSAGVITVNTVGSGNYTLQVDNSGVNSNGRVVIGAGGVHAQQLVFDPRGTSGVSTITATAAALKIASPSVTAGGSITLDVGPVIITPTAGSGTLLTGFTYTGPASTGQTASTEATEVLWTMPTKTWAAGALTTQRFFHITAPTVAFAGASTLTNAITLSVIAPAAGTNATLTNSYSIYATTTSGNTFTVGDESGHLALEQLGSGWMRFGPRNSNYLAGTGTFAFRNGNYTAGGFHWNFSGAGPSMWVPRDGAIVFTSTASNSLSPSSVNTALFNDSTSGLIVQRNSTNAQTFSISNTYTSSTNYEYGTHQWASNEWRIGTAVGSAGGTQRNTIIGSWNAAGTWAPKITIGPNANSGIALNNCTATGTFSFVFGSGCSSTANEGSFVGGINSTASGTQSSFSFGNTCTASGGYATPSVLGYESTASASSSHARGYRALADRYGMSAYSAGHFSATGDNQKVIFVARKKTTDGVTDTTLVLDGSSTLLTIPSGKGLSAMVTVKGFKSDGSVGARFRRMVDIKNVGGTTSLETTPETIGTDYNPSLCTLSIVADDTNDALKISVIGIASETWRWVAVVDGVELAYGT